MAGKPTQSGELARALVLEFPDASTLALSRVLRERYPEVYTSDNAAQCAVRYVRGAQGRKHAKQAIAPRPREDAERCRQWGALIPDPEPSEWRIEDLTHGVSKWLKISDIHMPYHDKKALTLALEDGEREGCRGILINGDGFDCYQMSDFCRDPRKRNMVDEVGTFCRFLDGLRERFGDDAEIIFKPGNHEMRLDRYMMQRAPELWGLPQFSWPALLELERRRIRFVPPMNPLRVGKLSILHGHELGKGVNNPVNPARGALTRTLSCVIVGHWHRTSEDTMQTLDGNVITAWSTGCLCELHADWCPINKWNHGFAIIHTPDRKSWRVENKRIVKGEVV